MTARRLRVSGNFGWFLLGYAACLALHGIILIAVSLR